MAYKLFKLKGNLVYENEFNNNKNLYQILKSFNYNSLSLFLRLGNNENIIENKNLLLLQKNALNYELKKINIKNEDIQKFTNIIDKCLASNTYEENLLYSSFSIMEENYRIQELLHRKMNKIL